MQLREKQKARRYYQVLEKQFRGYYDKATRMEGVTGENLLRLLECRFDNVLVRLGFAASRRQARQLIRHGHWTDQRPPGGHPLLPGEARRRDRDQARVSPATRHRAGRDGADLRRARLAAGRSRRAHRQGAEAPGARARSRRRFTSSSSSSCTRSRPRLQNRQKEVDDHPARFPGTQDLVRRRRTTTRARSRSSPSTRASATRSATACAACCSPPSAAPRSPASASRASRTSSRRSPASRRTSPTSSSTSRTSSCACTPMPTRSRRRWSPPAPARSRRRTSTCPRASRSSTPTRRSPRSRRRPSSRCT